MTTEQILTGLEAQGVRFRVDGASVKLVKTPLALYEQALRFANEYSPALAALLAERAKARRRA